MKDRKYYNKSESWESPIDSKGRKRPVYKKKEATLSVSTSKKRPKISKTFKDKSTTTSSYQRMGVESNKLKVFKSPELSTKTEEFMISEDGKKVFIFENGMLYSTDGKGKKLGGKRMQEVEFDVLSSESYEKGGTLGFNALSKKVALRYTGKKRK